MNSRALPTNASFLSSASSPSTVPYGQASLVALKPSSICQSVSLPVA